MTNMTNYNYKCVVAKNDGKRYYKNVSGKWKRISNKSGEKAEKGKKKYKFTDSEEVADWYKGITGTFMTGSNDIINRYLRCPTPKINEIIRDVRNERSCQWPLSFLVSIYTDVKLKTYLQDLINEHDEADYEYTLIDNAIRRLKEVQPKTLLFYDNETGDQYYDSPG